MTTQYGLIAIGNAIVDILAQTTEEFITSQTAFGMNRWGNVPDWRKTRRRTL